MTAQPFTESLNIKISLSVKQRLAEQGQRLEMTQSAMARLALALGLEAIEQLHATYDGREVRQ